MAAQDVKNYADENWNQYLESITELSKEQKNGNALEHPIGRCIILIR